MPSRFLAVIAFILSGSYVITPSVATASQSWQIQIHETHNTFSDGGNLAYLTPRSENLTVGGHKVHVIWNNVSVSGTFADALKFFPDGQGSVTGVLDRKLSPTQSKTLASRPLWRDADVLVVAPDNPLCTAGLSRTQAIGILTGTITTWHQILPSWPANAPASISLWVPTDAFGDVTVLFGIRKPAARATHGYEGTNIAYAGSAPGVIAAARWSGVRKSAAAGHPLCAIPINGHTPSDETVTAQTYPTSFTAYWVWPRKSPTFTRNVRKAYEHHLFGALGRKYFATYLDRDRLIAF